MSILHQLDDGTIETAEGDVLHFGLARFVQDVCVGDHCFVCGRLVPSDGVNEEHVVPDWIQRRYGLHGKHITLPNGTAFRYDQYKIPCCVPCNSEMGRVFEQPIQELVHGGYRAVRDHLLSEGPLLLFSWMALIFIKTHLKDRVLRLNRDQRKPPRAIATLYEWESLHQLHCVARAFKTGTVVSKEVIGSFLALPAAPTVGEEFDFVDVHQARSLMLRLEDTCLIAVLDDSCAALSVLGHVLEKITAPLTAPQRRELLAHFAFTNVVLDPRPTLRATIRDDRVALEADLPPTIGLRPHSPGEFDDLRALCFRSTFVDAEGRPMDVPDELRTGRVSFLFDGDTFIPSGRKRGS